MRKRTQLVGFEFGYWKHSQYVAEFLDNSLDAIETFQWQEINKLDSEFKFTLDKELTLQKLSIVQKEKGEEKKSQPLDEKDKHTLITEFDLEPVDNGAAGSGIIEIDTAKSDEIINKIEIEVEEEVKNIINEMDEIIKPVENIIDNEPMVIIRIREYEPPSFLTAELTQRNVMSYTFEIFDNGTGMNKTDLKKFGRYLASSKSLELKQTRGSQGFGAPSAFSDSQNTTGKPIVAVSKTTDNVYATVSEFFTTSKNEKKYLIFPTDIDTSFLHGTYIKLHYLNIKYQRGFADSYIRETSLLNPHVTLIFIDPYGEEYIYTRKVSNFPLEPKYAKAHPSSVNIGDLQDLLNKAENLSISSFLKENFVRISSNIAKEIIDLAERDLQDKLNILILESGFIEIKEKPSDSIYYLRNEKRIFGKSQNARDKLVIYEISSEDLKNKYWDLVNEYNLLNKKKEKVNKKIKEQNSFIEKAETQKIIKDFEKEIKNFSNEIEEIRDKQDKIKTELDNILKDAQDGISEHKKLTERTDLEELVDEVQLSKAKPSELTKEQFNSLFSAFKSIKYMAPPTDTAIPVGESVLENTLIKEMGLKISENLDNFDTPIENVTKSRDILIEEKKTKLKKEERKIEDNGSDEIQISDQEITDINNLILSYLNIENNKVGKSEINQTIINLLTYSDEPIETYKDLFEFFIETFSKDDDFIAAETREPTSGKGLAYVVEAVMAYSKNIEVPKRSRDVLSRFVNRTPKLRDSADCAITKAVQSVNWKNYKLEIYDNGLPKGPIKLLVNVSGPYVHLMFKSQSKSALADDEDLIKEIKYCLEAIGRKLRIYINRNANIHKREKRASLIEKYIPQFSKSLYNIVKSGESKYKDKINEKNLQNLMREVIVRKVSPIVEQKAKVGEVKFEPVVSLTKEQIEKEKSKIEVPVKEISQKEIIKKKEVVKEVVKEIKLPVEGPILAKKESEIKVLDSKVQDFTKLKVPSKAKKPDILKIIQEPITKKKVVEKKEVKKVKKPTIQEKLPIIKPEEVIKLEETEPLIEIKSLSRPPQPKQTRLPIVTTERIIEVLSNEWQTIKHLIFKLKIQDMMDARYLQIKLKQLEREEKVLVDVKMGKKSWKLK